MKNIVLVGFMGTGKTVIAKKLARQLKMRYLEVDSIIEQRQGMNINDIFRTRGEAYFRDVETEVVKELAEQEGLVVSTGGGVVLREENIQALGQSGVLICLTASPDEIYRRVNRETHRPLLSVADPMTEIKRLLKKREPFYNKIRRRVNTDGKNIDQVAAEIEKIIYEED